MAANGSLLKNVPVRKSNGHLYLNTSEEYDIEARRILLPSSTKEAGTFSSTKTITNSYKMIVSNLSKDKKSLHITERIPVSTQDNITVKLNGFFEEKGGKSELIKAIQYDIKLGKLELDITLPANATKQFTYGYEINYPEDIDISY